MQRKNSILRNHKSGFAMIMAITVIVVIATIMALSLSMTTQTTKRSTDLYLYEQAILLSKSATEYALLEISQANGCLASIAQFTQDGIYDIDISIKYIGTAPAGVDPSSVVCTDYIDNLATPESDGSVLLDVTVSTNASTEPIRYFKRTIQKL